MSGDPISGLSDRRYFHVALLSSRSRDFDANWIWGVLRKNSKICRGRYDAMDFDSSRFEFRTVEESAVYAGSAASREALASAQGHGVCAYDVFVGSAKKLVIFGTGYAALTRLLINRLASRGLSSQGWFLVPRLDDIVRHCREDEDPSQPVQFTVTGFSAFVPAVKTVRMLRLGGSDVFAGGLVDHIEGWLQRRGPSAGNSAKVDQEGAFLYQAVRLKATGSLTGSTVSITLAADGGCKMWLRKAAINLPGFAAAVQILNQQKRFDSTTQPPDWSEESEV